MCMSLRREDKGRRGEGSLFPQNRKGQYSEEEQMGPVSSEDIIRRIKLLWQACPGESHDTAAHEPAAVCCVHDFFGCYTPRCDSCGRRMRGIQCWGNVTRGSVIFIPTLWNKQPVDPRGNGECRDVGCTLLWRHLTPSRKGTGCRNSTSIHLDTLFSWHLCILPAPIYLVSPYSSCNNQLPQWVWYWL